MSANEQQEIWHVALASGEVRSMTVEELDLAFDEGHINVNTRVLAPGTTEWVRLGRAAGLDEHHAEPAPVPSVAPPAPVESLAPFAIGAPSPTSSLDFDPTTLNPPKNRGPLYVIGAVAALGIAYAAFSGSDGPPATNAAAGMVAGASTAAPALVDPTPKPQATQAAAPQDKLSDEQRKALLEVDKKNEARRKAKGGGALPGGSGPRSRPNEASPIKNGGDPNDPLNGKL